MTYNDLYEILRKEKYAETLQQLPKKFLEEFAEYINEKNTSTTAEQDIFMDAVVKSKKQLENAIAIFKELILRRKKKILNLVFVATETGIMKRDYENMLPQEKETFDRFIKAFEESDKEVARILAGARKKEEPKNKMIMFTSDVDAIVDPNGILIGPFKSGDLVNMLSDIATLFVNDGKASLIDVNE